MKKLALLFLIPISLMADHHFWFVPSVNGGLNISNVLTQTPQGYEYFVSKSRASYHLGGNALTFLTDKFAVNYGINYEQRGALWVTMRDQQADYNLITIRSFQVPFMLMYYIPTVSGNVELGSGMDFGYNFSATMETRFNEFDVSDELARYDFGPKIRLGYNKKVGMLGVSLYSTYSYGMLDQEIRSDNKPLTKHNLQLGVEYRLFARK